MVAASIILPTYRRFSFVLDTVEALLSQTCKDMEIIVVDQNNLWPAGQLARKNRLGSDDRVVWLAAAPGVVNARHSAVAVSRGDILIFVDDDVVIADKTFIDRHLANYRDTTIDAVVGRELPVSGAGNASVAVEAFADSSLVEQTIAFSRTAGSRTEICSFCTCNSSVRRSSFMRIGGFDEGFEGVSYGDDYDFAIRLCQAGGKIVFDPTCELVHLRAPMGGLRLSDRTNRANERDRALSGLIFFLRYGRGRLGFRLFYSGVLRKTVLLRGNLTAPWRLPSVLGGIVLAYRDARRVVRAGPRSRFSANARRA